MKDHEWQCINDKNITVQSRDVCFTRIHTEWGERCKKCKGPKWLGLPSKEPNLFDELRIFNLTKHESNRLRIPLKEETGFKCIAEGCDGTHDGKGNSQLCADCFVEKYHGKQEQEKVIFRKKDKKQSPPDLIPCKKDTCTKMIKPGGKTGMCRTCFNKDLGRKKLEKKEKPVCCKCGKPRSYGSAKWCRKCFEENAREKKVNQVNVNKCSICKREEGQVNIIYHSGSNIYRCDECIINDYRAMVAKGYAPKEEDRFCEAENVIEYFGNSLMWIDNLYNINRIKNKKHAPVKYRLHCSTLYFANRRLGIISYCCSSETYAGSEFPQETNWGHLKNRYKNLTELQKDIIKCLIYPPKQKEGIKSYLDLFEGLF